jgi:hypothetical protein
MSRGVVLEDGALVVQNAARVTQQPTNCRERHAGEEKSEHDPDQQPASASAVHG